MTITGLLRLVNVNIWVFTLVCLRCLWAPHSAKKNGCVFMKGEIRLEVPVDGILKIPIQD